MSTRAKVMRLLGAVIVVLAVAPWLNMSTATAADPPPSGDPRAISVDGNATTCSGGQNPAGLAGVDITSHVTFVVTGTFIDISAVDASYTVTGIVVKGGPAYNVYVPGQLGLGAVPPWNDLHSPMVGADDQNIAGISHWFVCGTTESTPSGEESTPSGEESTPGSSVLPTKIGSTGETSVLGTKVGSLAETGMNLPIGAAFGLSLGLLLAGGCLIALPGRLAVERKRRH